jgi:hypothetical protein
MNADPIEARPLTAGDECRDVGQGPTDRNAKSDTEAGHLTNSLLI